MIFTCWGPRDGWCGKRHFVESKAKACAASLIGGKPPNPKGGRPAHDAPPNGRPTDRAVYIGRFTYETIRDTGRPPT